MSKVLKKISDCTYHSLHFLEFIFLLINISIGYTVLIEKEDYIAAICDSIPSEPCMTTHFERFRHTMEHRTIDKACNHDVLPSSLL